MNEINNKTNNAGCRINLFGLIILIFFLYALWFGVPTSWGTFNIDLFLPKIYME